MGVVLQVVDGRISLKDMWPGAVAAKSVLETELKPDWILLKMSTWQSQVRQRVHKMSCQELACCTSALDLSVHPAVLV